MEVNFFHNGTREFLRSLDKATGAKAVQLVELLSMREYNLSMPFSKKLEKDLYELRVQSLQSVRIFYTFCNGKIVLLHAIYKKSQKLNSKDLDVARKRLVCLQSI